MGILNFLFGKTEQPKQTVALAKDMTIKPNAQQLAMVALRQKGTQAKTREALINSGYIKDGKVDALMECMQTDALSGVGVNYTKPPTHGELLTLEEKKALGLNARMKYSKWFIDLFKPEALTEIEPKGWLEGLVLGCGRKAHREAERERRKQLGIKEVQMSALLGTGECAAARKLNGKKFAIDEEPDLPLPQCDSGNCMCGFNAVIPLD